MNAKMREAVTIGVTMKTRLGVDVLSGMRALIGANGERWTRGAHARLANGEEISDATDMSATAWCYLGGIDAVIARADIKSPWPYAARGAAVEMLADGFRDYRGNPSAVVIGGNDGAKRFEDAAGVLERVIEDGHRLLRRHGGEA